jgi:hypothetical protein
VSRSPSYEADRVFQFDAEKESQRERNKDTGATQARI